MPNVPTRNYDARGRGPYAPVVDGARLLCLLEVVARWKPCDRMRSRRFRPSHVEPLEHIQGRYGPDYHGRVGIRARRGRVCPCRAGLSAQLSPYENGHPSPTPAVIARLERALHLPIAQRVERHRDAIRHIVAQHHALNPRVIGSVARGDAAPASDLDILVDFNADASVLDEVGLRLALSDLLQANVDVVAADTLRGALRERVLGEAVPV